MKIIVGSTYSKVEGAGKSHLDMIDDELAVKTPGYFFSPSFKNKHWDGKTRFFNRKDNTFPSGLLRKVVELLEDVELEASKGSLDIEVPEEITLIEPEAEGGIITLRDYQYDAVYNAIKMRRGIVNVATNGGKTEIASGIIKLILPHLETSETILFVTHSKEIFHQSAKRIEKRLNIKVGKVGDGEWDIKPVTLVMIPTVSKYTKKPTVKNITYTKEMKSLKKIVMLLDDFIAQGYHNRQLMIDFIQVLEGENEKDYDEKAIEILSHIVQKQKNDEGCRLEYQKLKKDLRAYEKKKLEVLEKSHVKVMELLRSAKCFIGDEFHHSSSVSWYDTIMICENAEYRIGLTGTVDRKDEINYMRLVGCSGEILTKISNDFLISKGYSAKPTIYLKTITEPSLSKDLTWQEAYKHGVVENKVRNESIVEQVRERYEKGDGCLIIVNHISHGDILKKLLEDNGVECEFTHGGFSGREQVLDDMKTGKLKALIATSILDEGVDISGINSLWLASGGKSFRQVLQRIGRGLRKKEDGSGIRVYDFLDYTQEYLTKHSLERYQYFKNEKFDIKKLK